MIIYAGFCSSYSLHIRMVQMDKIHQSCDIHFESLMVNEFHGREFECGQYIP